MSNENLFTDISFYPIGADELHKMYQSTINKIERTIDFPDRITLPEMENVESAYLGILPAVHFLSLIVEEDEIVKRVLYDNVRDFQGENNDVNEDIQTTLKSLQADKFVILNNGITIICKELKNIVRNKFLLSDYQIVNGCQTSHVLFYNRQFLTDNVYVTVKIISTTNEDAVNQIIKATNRQSPVTDEQMMALKDFHKKLESFYETFRDSKKLYYERRSKQYASNPAIEKVRIVTIPSQIKSFSSMFMDKPHIASRYYGKLLKDTDGIFDKDHKPIVYYTAAYTLYRIDFLIRNKQVDKKYKPYRYHLLMMLKYLLLNGEPQATFNSHIMERFCESFLHIVNDNVELLKHLEQVLTILNNSIPELNNAENAKTLTIVDTLKKACNHVLFPVCKNEG